MNLRQKNLFEIEKRTTIFAGTESARMLRRLAAKWGGKARTPRARKAFALLFTSVLFFGATARLSAQPAQSQTSRTGDSTSPDQPASKSSGKPAEAVAKAADDKAPDKTSGGTSDSKPSSAGKDEKKDEKADSDSGLTPRERLLLDRIEKLEKRLADVEAHASGGSGSSVDSARPVTKPAPNGVVAADAPNNAANPATAAGAIAVATPATNESQDQNAKPAKKDPFAFADFTWLTGNSREKDVPLDTKFFTPEIRVDANYTESFNHPKDNTIGGSSEIFRSGEVQLTQLGVGGDFHWENVRARLMTQFGLYSQTTPRNDASPSRGQWNLDNAYRYLSEAYGGYHIDKLNGINIDAGIFMSYVGLFSYYQYDNWAYQPSYVSSNTPWFFNGVRIQIFPSDKLKIEPWFVNGWQSYGKFNKAPGVGMQLLWRPTGSLSLLSNNYIGADTLGIPGRKRIHTDNSIQYKYLDRPEKTLDKAAFTFTVDAGCEFGQNSGVSCTGQPGRPAQYFLGFMAYNRFWFHKDLFGLTLGGGAINNPGRYLVLIPPINGATAASGTPYFTANPGDPYKAWDASLTFDYMPTQYSTFRFEFNHRASNVPYFSGPNGITPLGGNTGPAGSFVPGFSPDLRKYENRITLALLVKF